MKVYPTIIAPYYRSAFLQPGVYIESQDVPQKSSTKARKSTSSSGRTKPRNQRSKVINGTTVDTLRNGTVNYHILAEHIDPEAVSHLNEALKRPSSGKKNPTTAEGIPRKPKRRSKTCGEAGKETKVLNRANQRTNVTEIHGSSNENLMDSIKVDTATEDARDSTNQNQFTQGQNVIPTNEPKASYKIKTKALDVNNHRRGMNLNNEAASNDINLNTENCNTMDQREGSGSTIEEPVLRSNKSLRRHLSTRTTRLAKLSSNDETKVQKGETAIAGDGKLEEAVACIRDDTFNNSTAASAEVNSQHQVECIIPATRGRDSSLKNSSLNHPSLYTPKKSRKIRNLPYEEMTVLSHGTSFTNTTMESLMLNIQEEAMLCYLDSVNFFQDNFNCRELQGFSLLR